MLSLRVDDRLIHTQVVAGWIQAQALNRIIVANDEIARDPMRALVLELALPPGISFSFCPVEDVARQVQANARQMVIVASLACASRVITHLPSISEINLANCSRHTRQPDAQAFSASVWLTPEEQAQLQLLRQQNINVVHHLIPPR